MSGRLRQYGTQTEAPVLQKCFCSFISQSVLDVYKSSVVKCRAMIELLALNINVPLYFNFRVRHNIQRLAHDQSSVQEHLEKQVLGIYTNAKFSAEATVLQ